MIRLEYNSCGDIECPSCKQKFDIDWDTEYGDPIIGDHSVKCYECGEYISFGVYIQYIQPHKENS